ncbi:MAG: ribosome assembly factor SBDS [Nanoarchaeota archaeon]
MVSVDEAVIARLKKGGANLEVLVDCEKAIEYRESKGVSLEDVLATEKIFSDAKKGMVASESQLESLFETTDPGVIADKIIKEGEVQLTAEYKNKLLREKKNKILQMIHNNAIDPKTGNPIPISRLELALEEAKIRISEHRTNEEQAKEIVKKLHAILPIKIDKVTIRVKIPAIYAGKCYAQVKGMGEIVKEEWLNDGSWLCMLETPAGRKNEIIDKINNFTKGESEIKVN